MKRISHDLPGVTQRIARLRDDLSQAAANTQQIWCDDKGRQFFQQHIADVAPTLSQLISSLTQSVEQFEDIAKKVLDPDQNS